MLHFVDDRDQGQRIGQPFERSGIAAHRKTRDLGEGFGQSRIIELRIGEELDLAQGIDQKRVDVVRGHGHREGQLNDLVEERPEFAFVGIGQLAEFGFQPLDDYIVVDGQDKDALLQVEDVFQQFEDFDGDRRVDPVEIVDVEGEALLRSVTGQGVADQFGDLFLELEDLRRGT